METKSFRSSNTTFPTSLWRKWGSFIPISRISTKYFILESIKKKKSSKGARNGLITNWGFISGSSFVSPISTKKVLRRSAKENGWSSVKFSMANLLSCWSTRPKSSRRPIEKAKSGFQKRTMHSTKSSNILREFRDLFNLSDGVSMPKNSLLSRIKNTSELPSNAEKDGWTTSTQKRWNPNGLLLRISFWSAKFLKREKNGQKSPS